MPGILDELDMRNVKVFKKDFSELFRVYNGINELYAKMGKDVDKYIFKFKEAIKVFNEKYGLVVRLDKALDSLKLRVFLKEESVRDVFSNVASKVDGLNSIGIKSADAVKVEETDRFSKELDNAKDKLFVSYNGTVALFKVGEEGIEIIGEGIFDGKTGEFEICAYYAVKGGVKDVDVHERLVGFGFFETTTFEKVSNFLKRFNPRIGE